MIEGGRESPKPETRNPNGCPQGPGPAGRGRRTAARTLCCGRPVGYVVRRFGLADVRHSMCSTPTMDTHTATEYATTTANRVASFLTSDDLHADVARARWLAQWLDTKFSVGGVRFGLQGIVGMVPFAGDTLTTVAGLYPVLVAYRHKLGGEVIGRLLANLALQWVMGLLPWVGDYADVWFKANLRNVAVLDRAAMAAR